MGKWGNIKQKPFRQIQAYSHIFRHIQTHSDKFIHNQAYSQPCATLAYSELWYISNPGIFKTRGILKTLVYPKLWHIQNQRHIQNPGLGTLEYSEPEVYSDHCHISMMKRFEKQLTTIIIFVSHNQFHNISFSCPLVHEINMICLMQV